VLAVKVDFEAGQATVGTKSGTAVSTNEILAAIESLGYRAEVVNQPP
jgi:copper chaperone CopZ